MILTVDIGNSNIVIGAWADDKLSFVARLQTEREKTADGFAIEIRSVLTLNDASPAQIEGAVLSSVVPQVTFQISAALKKLTGSKPIVVGPGVKTGLNILIDNPAQLGSDMVADAVGASSRYPLPAIIIDMGTATKIMALDKSGSFLGCAIMPGIRIGLDALAERTASLPQIGLEPPRDVIGKNTDDSMKSGSLYGTASMIDGMVSRFESQLGPCASVVATGGFSGDIAPFCQRSVIIDPDLTLEGLYRVYQKNVKDAPY
jgi:type III pantothenate kinase